MDMFKLYSVNNSGLPCNNLNSASVSKCVKDFRTVQTFEKMSYSYYYRIIPQKVHPIVCYLSNVVSVYSTVGMLCAQWS